MTRRLGSLAFMVLGLALGGCPHPNTSSSSDAGTAPPSSTQEATNAADVTRFPDEEPFGPTAVVAQDKTAVRTAPGGGDLVATLPAGVDVTKLSAHGTDDLVCFEDPKGGRHLMGWVPQSALQDATPPGPPPAPPPPLPGADDGGTTPPPAPTPPAPTPRGHHHKKKHH